LCSATGAAFVSDDPGDDVCVASHAVSPKTSWRAETQTRWTGRAYGSLLITVQTNGMWYQFSGDGAYGSFYIAEINPTPDGQGSVSRVERFGSWSPVQGQWYVFSMETTSEGLALAVNGVIVLTYVPSGPLSPLNGILLRSGWVSTNEFDFVKVTGMA